MAKQDLFNSLAEPIPITNQHWDENPLPLVSISCITYNHAPFIRDTLEGFLAQKTAFPVEILIHDDASTDGTAEIIQEYEQKYPDLIYPVYQLENQYSQGVRGMMARFNFPRARGRYIALCEGDDYWVDPLKLQKQVDVFLKYPGTIICGARAKTWKENKKEFTVTTPALDKNISCMTPEQFFQLGDWVKTCTRMASREIMLSIPMEYAMDYRNVHYLLAKNPNGTFRCLDEVVAVYREHAGGVFSGVDTISQQKEYFESAKIIAKLYDDERAVIMHDNALYTAEELTFTSSLALRERVFYTFQLIILTFSNFSFAKGKQTFNRILYRLFKYLDRYQGCIAFLQSLYRVFKKTNK